MSPDPKSIRVGKRDVAYRWSMRADYRLPFSKRRDLLTAGYNGDSALVVSTALWAMLWTDEDRRRWKTAEDMHASLPSPEEDPGWWKEAWKAMMLEAFNVDVDEPSKEVEEEQVEEKPADDPPPFQETKPSPSPSLSLG